MKILMHKTSDKTIAPITWNLLVIIVISACYLLDLNSLTCTLHVHVYEQLTVVKCTAAVRSTCDQRDCALCLFRTSSSSNVTA